MVNSGNQLYSFLKVKRMADKHHVALLRQGFKVWNPWRKSHPEIISKFKGADLTRLKLFKVDLSSADLP